MFQVLGFIGSVLSASATVARGQEIKRQKEAEAAQIEQERFQRKIQTMEAHNDILDQLEEAEEQNEALYGFMNRDDDNSLNAFRRSQKDLANSDLKRVGFKGLAEQEQLKSLLERHQEERERIRLSEASAERSPDPTSADGGSMAFELEKELTLDENTKHLLNQIEHALVLIKKKKYGICESCSKPIPVARLEALPYSSYCKDCAALIDS